MGLFSPIACVWLVAGPHIEARFREENAGDPKYGFLVDGGEGNDYYRARLAELRAGQVLVVVASAAADVEEG